MLSKSELTSYFDVVHFIMGVKNVKEKCDLFTMEPLFTGTNITYMNKHNLYLSTLKTYHPDYIFYFTNPENVSEIIVIVYHSLTSL